MKKFLVKIDEKKCKECLLCIEECPKKILEISHDVNEAGYHPAKVTDQSKCIGCTFCAIACPECIIEVTKIED